MANSSTPNDQIIKFVLDYYKIICSKKTQTAIENNLNSYTPQMLRTIIKSGDLRFFTIIEPFYNISFEQIRTAAKFLRIELDEYVTIKTEDGKTIKTDRPVPVGVTYLQFLEHFSSQYASVGGAQKYSGLSKQPMKMGSGQNVSALGQMDINALITYEVDGILQELLTARSDHHKAKRRMYMDIVETGKAVDLIKDTGTGGTAELKNIYLTSLGLNIK